MAADVRQAETLGIELRAAPGAAFAGPAPRIADAAAPSLAERSCLVISPAPDGKPRELILPPGGAVLEASSKASATLRLRRLATRTFPVLVGTVRPGEKAALRIPADNSDRPWQMAVESREMLSVCGVQLREESAATP